MIYIYIIPSVPPLFIGFFSVPRHKLMDRSPLPETAVFPTKAAQGAGSSWTSQGDAAVPRFRRSPGQVQHRSKNHEQRHKMWEIYGNLSETCGNPFGNPWTFVKIRNVVEIYGHLGFCGKFSITLWAWETIVGFTIKHEGSMGFIFVFARPSLPKSTQLGKLQ